MTSTEVAIFVGSTLSYEQDKAYLKDRLKQESYSWKKYEAIFREQDPSFASHPVRGTYLAPQGGFLHIYYGKDACVYWTSDPRISIILGSVFDAKECNEEVAHATVLRDLTATAPLMDRIHAQQAVVQARQAQYGPDHVAVRFAQRELAESEAKLDGKLQELNEFAVRICRWRL